VGVLVRTITASFTALTLALLYFDLRARRAGVTTARSDAQPPHDAA
jgi:hypothetical protein